MNFYLLVEGKSTEPKLYRKWLRYLFPDHREVSHASELDGQSFRIRSAGGYPLVLKLLRESCEEIQASGKRLDRFFLCLDAEEQSYAARYQEASQALQRLTPPFPFVVIVQDCCIETWLLGDRGLTRRPARKPLLQSLRAGYDVQVKDPELLPTGAGFATRARFHLHYLKAVLQDREDSSLPLHYSKSDVGYFGRLEALRALANRNDETGHLQSFGILLAEWRSLGAQLTHQPEGSTE